MEKVCKYCGRAIVEDFTKWLRENPQTKYMQCPYCFEMEKIE